MLTTYTDYQEVRAVLGLTLTELPDDVLALPMYETMLVVKLEDLALALPTDYQAVEALPSESRTATQARFYDLTRLFSAYATAKELLTALPMLGVRSLTDGKAQFTRQSDQWQEIVSGVETTFDILRFRLKLVYSATYGGTAPASIVGISTTTAGMTDPVTGV